MHSIELEAGLTNVKYYYSSPQSPFSTFQTQNNGNNVDDKETTISSSFSKISPLTLLVIIILAIIFFIYGLIHLVLWFLLKRPSSQPLYNSNRFPETTPTRSRVLHRQLQHLFNLNDSGLEKAVIDTFPIFNYKDLMGLKEPFDCAICLSEFSEVDKLRLLPMCTHAFHMNCLDTWLLSNSTCPLCRATFSSSCFNVENVDNSLALPRVIDEEENTIGFSDSQRVFSVRFGKFRNNNNNNGLDLDGSSCSLDERRCYSMGSYEYVVRDLNLQVVLSHCCDEREDECGEVRREYPSENENVEGKRIGNRGKGESLSVSKIWLWSKKSKFPSSSDVVFP